MSALPDPPGTETLPDRLREALGGSLAGAEDARLARLLVERLDGLIVWWERRFPRVPPEMGPLMKAQSELAVLLDLRKAAQSIADMVPADVSPGDLFGAALEEFARLEEDGNGVDEVESP